MLRLFLVLTIVLFLAYFAYKLKQYFLNEREEKDTSPSETKNLEQNDDDSK